MFIHEQIKKKDSGRRVIRHPAFGRQRNKFNWIHSAIPGRQFPRGMTGSWGEGLSACAWCDYTSTSGRSHGSVQRPSRWSGAADQWLNLWWRWTPHWSDYWPGVLRNTDVAMTSTLLVWRIKHKHGNQVLGMISGKVTNTENGLIL